MFTCLTNYLTENRYGNNQYEAINSEILNHVPHRKIITIVKISNLNVFYNRKSSLNFQNKWYKDGGWLIDGPVPC